MMRTTISISSSAISVFCLPQQHHIEWFGPEKMAIRRIVDTPRQQHKLRYAFSAVDSAPIYPFYRRPSSDGRARSHGPYTKLFSIQFTVNLQITRVHNGRIETTTRRIPRRRSTWCICSIGDASVGTQCRERKHTVFGLWFVPLLKPIMI